MVITVMTRWASAHPGRGQEPAGDADGEGVVVDRCPYLRAQLGVAGPGGGRRVDGLAAGRCWRPRSRPPSQRGQPDRATDLLAGVQQAGGQPGVLVGTRLRATRDSGTKSRPRPTPVTSIGPSSPPG